MKAYKYNGARSGPRLIENSVPDPHQSGKSDPDPHQSEKSDPDPHQNENNIHILGIQVNAVQALQNNITHTDNLLKKSRKRPNKEKKFKGFKKKNKSKNSQEKK